MEPANPYEATNIDTEVAATPAGRSRLFALVVATASLLHLGYLYLVPRTAPPGAIVLSVRTAFHRSGIVEMALSTLAAGLAGLAWFLLSSQTSLLRSTGQILLGAAVATLVLSFLID